MTISPANNMDVKRRNRVNTLRCILKSDRVSQMELTQKLALSWPTILQNVKELTELGLVREDGVYASTGGRKAKAYAPVRDARVAVGVDLTADHVGVVLTDLGGNLLKQATGALRFSMEEIYFKYLGGLLQRFVEANGAAFVLVPADRETFQIDCAALEERITARTQAVIVNSPNNPSGVIYTRATLEKLAEVLTRKSAEHGHPIYVISDEPYRELVYGGAEVPFLPDIYPNTVICYSYSKSLSMPGERIGYVCVPDRVEDSQAVYAAAAGAARILGHVCAPSLQQRVVAACAASRPDLEAYDRNRVTLYDALTSYGYRCVKPDGAFYLFVQAPGGDAQAFSDQAKARNLLIVPGGDFGCPDYFRASTCVSHEMLLRSLPIFEDLMKPYL